MKENNYESVVIINASLEDNQITDTINRIKDYITSNGGKIDEIEEWGRKRLAYPILKAKSGFYLIVRFTSKVDFITKLERFLKIDETVIRYLTVSLDSRALEYYKNKKEKEAQEPEPKTEEPEKEISSDSKD